MDYLFVYVNIVFLYFLPFCIVYDFVVLKWNVCSYSFFVLFPQKHCSICSSFAIWKCAVTSEHTQKIWNNKQNLSVGSACKNSQHTNPNLYLQLVGRKKNAQCAARTTENAEKKTKQKVSHILWFVYDVPCHLIVLDLSCFHCICSRSSPLLLCNQLRNIHHRKFRLSDLFPFDSVKTIDTKLLGRRYKQKNIDAKQSCKTHSR